VDFILISENSSCGNGSISAFITDGEPTFTYQWSPNVNGQTGATVTNLSAGTYTLKVIDDTGCYKQKSITLTGTNSLSTYQVFNVCDNTFENSGIIGKKGALQMLVEGYYDLISGDTNCVLNEAIFEANVIISGVSASTTFYTGTTLTEYPSDQLWANTIKDLILTYSGITNVILDLPNNKITIKTDCDSEISYDDVQVLVNMVIHYDISCVSCGVTCGYEDSSCELDGFCDVNSLNIPFPMVGIDFLDDKRLHPTCEEIENYVCESLYDKEEEWRAVRNVYNVARNQNLIAKYAGAADSDLINLSFHEKYLTNPDNETIMRKVGFKNVNLKNWRNNSEYPEWFEVVCSGQSLNDIFPGVEQFVFLPMVNDISEAPTGIAGDLIQTRDSLGRDFYWSPITNNWELLGVSDCIGDKIADLFTTFRAQRDAVLKHTNQVALAILPYLYSGFYLPVWHIKKYKNY
jgi:hypothetical protein